MPYPSHVSKRTFINLDNIITTMASIKAKQECIAIFFLWCSLPSNAFLIRTSIDWISLKSPVNVINPVTNPYTVLFEEHNNSEKENNDNDDGWGMPPSMNKNEVTTEYGMKQYKSLVATTSEQQQQSETKSVTPIKVNGNERDLFIPIFTIVSIVGFVGAYGYETLRLYMNDELYLPF